MLRISSGKAHEIANVIGDDTPTVCGGCKQLRFVAGIFGDPRVRRACHIMAAGGQGSRNALVEMAASRCRRGLLIRPDFHGFERLFSGEIGVDLCSVRLVER